jgi:hypothetical protein
MAVAFSFELYAMPFALGAMLQGWANFFADDTLRNQPVFA